MSELAIDARNVVVTYGSFRALNDLTFQAPYGQIVGLLGPNGAGKSTFVDTVVGAHRPVSGSVLTLGCNPVTQAHHLRSKLGVVLQSAGFPAGLKVKDVLYSWRNYIPSMSKRRVQEIADEVDITRLLNRPIHSLSGGEQRRVDFAIALFGDPKLLVLDEPTTGLDPSSRSRVWHIIEEQKAHGATVLLTSHYLDEIEQLCDQVSVIKNGRIEATGTPRELARSVISDRRCTVELARPLKDPDLKDLGALGESLAACAELRTLTESRPAPAGQKPALYSWLSHDPPKDLRALIAFSDKTGNTVHDVSIEPPSLDAAYESLVGVTPSQKEGE